VSIWYAMRGNRSSTQPRKTISAIIWPASDVTFALVLAGDDAAPAWNLRESEGIRRSNCDPI